MPYIVHESAMARQERNNKRLWIALIVSLCLWAATVGAVIYYESQFVDESVWQEVDTGEGDAYIAGIGDVNYGEGQAESDTAPTLPAYSYAAPPEQVESIIDYQGDTDFAAVIDGRRADDVWPIMEELMEVLRRTNKPLYNATIRKIKD